MRNALAAAAAILAGVSLLAGPASAAPALADHAASSKAQIPALVEEARSKRAGKQVSQKQVAGKQVYVRKGRKYQRRDDWTYTPYWRPFQYRYWKYIYPYGGPLF